MKNFSRLITLSVVMVFAISSFAQTTLMTKAQALGLKSSSPVYNTPIQTTSISAVYLEEGFDVDGDFPPTDWTQTIVNVDNTWLQSNPENNNFNTIDPNSLFSALVPWVGADQDEWLMTPEISAPMELPLSLDFYAGVSGPWITAATLKCHISTDGGTTWVELWDAADMVDPAADWAWYPISLDISDYAMDDFMVAWQYVGNDGDLAGIDGVAIQAGYEYIYEDDFEGWNVGDYLVETDQTGMWDTWSSDPGSAEDALVSDVEAYSPTKSVIVDGISDLVLKLGNKTSGHYVVNVMYYIPSGFGGYVNLQHFEAPGNEWAVEVYFGAATGAENGYMLAGSPDQIPFSFNHDEWFLISFDVDLDDDWATCYIDGEMTAEWQFSLQADGAPGTLQLGGMNIFAGAPGNDTPMFYFDNVEYIVLDPGISNPIIDVDPASIFTTLEEGQSTTEMFTISNSGQEDLEFQIVTTYPQSKKGSYAEPTGANTPKSLYAEPQLGPKSIHSSEAPTTRDDVLLHYDFDNMGNGIGNANDDYQWRVAAMFPAEMLAPYVGMELNEVHIFINDEALETKAQVYGMGSYNTPGPGDMLAEQDFTGTPYSWNVIELDSPIAIDGQDIWVGYWLSGTANTFVAGCDEGPVDPNGDWISHGPGWGHLSDNPALPYNWNIRANLTGEPIVQWLSADPATGNIVQDESLDISVTIDASGLVSDTYTGQFLVRNNDPTNEEVAVAVTLGVLVGVDENGENEYVAVYPNPANSILNIKSSGDVTNVTLANAVGQVVYRNTTGNAIDISNYERGVYFITIETANGTTTQKVLVQ